jgi:hypothetical protein
MEALSAAHIFHFGSRLTVERRESRKREKPSFIVSPLPLIFSQESFDVPTEIILVQLQCRSMILPAALRYFASLLNV